MRKISCSVGVMAYNEAANIGKLLKALAQQESNRVVVEEIIVVASGCTDGTEDIVLQLATKYPKIRLLRQVRREGKASAVNLLMRNIKTDVVVLQSADTIPLPGTIEALVSPFSDPKVGMVGGHPVPVNKIDEFMGYGIHLLWELHHQLSLHSPKMGELIAFRNIFRQIPPDTAVDEASIEPLIVGQGLELRYAPEAVVRNKGPETFRDFMLQRRRIFAGHLYLKDTLGYQVSSVNGFRVLGLFLKNWEWNWRYLVWGTGIGLVEFWARLAATFDYYFLKKKPYNWEIAQSTKDLTELPET